jgi:hypothetical protein
LKCGTGEGCRLSVGPSCEKNEVLQTVKKERNILQIIRRRKEG